MEQILDDICSVEDLKKHEKKFNQELCNGKVSASTQFEYACFLVRSNYPADIRKGIMLLEELYTDNRETGKRDYVFYMAIGNARLEDYSTALSYLDGLLKIEPDNRQFQEFKSVIKKRMEKKAIKGAAIAGGLVLGFGALVGMGVALARK